MIKPLNFFYSITAYSYATIILNNPIKFSLDMIPGSHAIDNNKNHTSTRMGAWYTQGTFTDLFAAFPTTLYKSKDYEIVQNNSESILEFFQNDFTVDIGLLLSMIPEIRDYYFLTTKKPSRTHPMSITHKYDSGEVKWEFLIGDGNNKPSNEDVQKSFSDFRITEREGKYVITIPAKESHNIKASIQTDINGSLWYVENPLYPIILPEMCIHFVLTNAFSNVMRYSPDKWNNILFNEADSNISLIVRRYLSAFEQKFPILLLRNISLYYPNVV